MYSMYNFGVSKAGAHCGAPKADAHFGVPKSTSSFRCPKKPMLIGGSLKHMLIAQSENYKYFVLYIYSGEERLNLFEIIFSLKLNITSRF